LLSSIQDIKLIIMMGTVVILWDGITWSICGVRSSGGWGHGGVLLEFSSFFGVVIVFFVVAASAVDFSDTINPPLLLTRSKPAGWLDWEGVWMGIGLLCQSTPPARL